VGSLDLQYLATSRLHCKRDARVHSAQYIVRGSVTRIEFACETLIPAEYTIKISKLVGVYSMTYSE
jgi:hypothetical protein